jgi:multidrug efflux pump subunit AcrB
VVAKAQWPLLGATFVAILAFAAIGFTPGNVGEFCRSLFKVMAASLLFSWLLAMTVTPLFCVWFLPKPKKAIADPYDRLLFRIYRRFLHSCLRLWPVSFSVLVVMLIAAIIGFDFIPPFFFSDSSQPQFYVDYWRPQGTHIEKTAEDVRQIQEFVSSMEGVTEVTSFVGEGALRFVLSYDYTPSNSSFGQLLVTVDDYQKIKGMIPKINEYMQQNFPDSEPKIKLFANGPSPAAKIEAEFRGPDEAVLYDLCGKAKAIMRDDPHAMNIRDDWRHMGELKRPVFSESIARRTGITRSDLEDALQMTFGGIPVGLYREANDLLPIIVRPPAEDRGSFNDRKKIHIFSPALGQTLPFEQLVEEIQTVREPPMIRRENRVRAIKAQCDPQGVTGDSLFEKLRPKLESIPLLPGYSLDWKGDYYYSHEAKSQLAKVFPVCLLGMFVILIWQFNAMRQPIIIFLCLPLSIIGVTAGLLLTGLPFGFMAILGFLGLSGMLIKNAIVLMDQIDMEIRDGKQPYQAVLDSAVSRMRPVVMASGTTVLGMTPLVADPFYAVMAVTVAGGLVGATVLTLIVVPLFYCLFFRIKPTVQ